MKEKRERELSSINGTRAAGDEVREIVTVMVTGIGVGTGIGLNPQPYGYYGYYLVTITGIGMGMGLNSQPSTFKPTIGGSWCRCLPANTGLF